MAAPTASPPFSVTGKTAIVTGAGSGISLGFAELLLSRNCNVVIADLSLRPEAQSVVDLHTGSSDGQPRAVFVKTDVTDWDALTAVFDVAEREFGGADIICPGAGIFEPHWSNFWHPPGTATSRDSAHGTGGLGHYTTLDINLTHPIRTTQLALARWLRADASATPVSVPASVPATALSRRPRRIVHISSMAAQGSALSIPLYIASKAGLSGFVRSMAGLDEICGVKVAAVAPGLVRTPLWTEHPEKMRAVVSAPDEAWATPADIAAAMLRCCEDPTVPAGAVMEVTVDGTRFVSVFNDPGPANMSSAASVSTALGNEVLEWLAAPGWGMPV